MSEHVVVIDPKTVTRLDDTKLNAELRGLNPGEVVALHKAFEKRELYVQVGSADAPKLKVVNVWVNPAFMDRAFLTFRDK